uniref:FH2 domain-containing protein n=1 Tax=Romanomermis culicivorax TaxID=13658 RepID=A0A915I9K0_ROMCU
MEKKLIQQQPADNRRESEVQWERAMENLNRPLIINDLDFTELEDMDDCDPLRVGPARLGLANGAPMAPPPMGYGMPPPPNSLQLPPPPFCKTSSPTRSESPNTKDLRTVKLFWKEAQLQQPSSVLESKGVFWQKVKPVDIDTEKVIQLFETKSAKDVVVKNQGDYTSALRLRPQNDNYDRDCCTIGMGVKKKEDKKHEILVLDTKRSNAINIGLTKLPPPRAIKTAIIKFDSTILNKECLEKILTTMIPSEEEKEKIADAQASNPDLPLGSAEQCLMLLGEVPMLYPRLKLWLFMLDYASTEKEVAEPLMNLKLAMEELEQSRTFQNVMGTLLAVGNILNGAEVKGFQLDFLAKVPEIKDTIYKHSLVYHLCAIVMDKFPDSTDLFSELGAIARCSKVDFDEIQQNLEKLEKDCKSSWDYLKALSICQRQENYSANSGLNKKIGEFLSDCAQRIMTLKVIHRRVINRFRKFLLYMGIPQNAVKDTKINSTCKTIAEFALEYRTCRDKILQQKKRQMDKRERNKTRGKLITENLPGVSVVQPSTRRSSKSDQNSLTAVNGVGSSGGNKQEALNKVLNASSGQEDEGWRSFPGVRLRHRRNFSPNSKLPNWNKFTVGPENDKTINSSLIYHFTSKRFYYV